MNLQTLKTRLDSAGTTASIGGVYFDYSDMEHVSSKDYPVVLWNVDDMEMVRNRRTGEDELTVDVYCMNLVTPETDKGHNKLAAWDTIEAYLEAYMAAVAGEQDITVEGQAETAAEYYPAGLMNLEREMAVRWRVRLKLWC